MLKKKLLAAVMSAICVVTAVPSYAVLADGQKVVTLGADLTEDQKNAILRYFGIAGQNIQTLTITNTDEREHLGSYVPLEQIGTRTYSCALVSPTNSGGIQVKTANLSWVTSNMIATTLSTSGVVNCDVLAAAPFEVSGTGALTGILMAYESAVGTTLDSAKKDVATQELITTTTIADSIGQVNATEIVNDTKMQVIEGNVISDNDIDVIINEVADEQNITLSDEDRALLADLMKKIAEQDYNYDDMKQTLERVESNLEELSDKVNSETDTSQTDAAQTDAPQTDAAQADTDTAQTEELSEDSILMNTDDSALGDSVIFDATNEDALTETEAPAQSESSADFDITTSDSYSDGQDAGTGDGTLADTADTQAPADSAGASDGADIVIDGAQAGESTDGAVITDDSQNTDITADTPQETDPASADAAQETDPASAAGDAAAETAAPEETAAITADEMVFAPNSLDAAQAAEDEQIPAGVNQLFVYFPRTDIAAGTGTLTVTDASGNTVETISTSDTTKAAIEPMTDEELLDQSWTEGVKAVIYLGEPLAQLSEYHVALSADAFVTADGTAHSEEVAQGSWDIKTSEYGFCIDQPGAAGVTAGTTVSGQVMMDGTAAAYAVIENADPAAVTFDTTEFTASGSFNATFGASGTTSFQVSFYDAAGGNLLDTIDYTITVK